MAEAAGGPPFQLLTTNHFERALAKFTQAHPELRGRLRQVLQQLEANPFEAHLRLHALHGNLEGLYGIALTRAYRITLRLDGAERELVLFDIDSHDDVYR